ncbi:Fc.00g043150.m01.CDS01 [Cosmosporella sp. VM-42]
MAVPKSLPAFERSASADLAGFKAASSRIKKLRENREMKINLHHHYASKVFSPGSVITGDVIITPKNTIKCDGFQISLTGRSLVHHEDGQIQTTTSHNFLKLDMPIQPTSYPPSGVFQSGNTYSVPFDFTVPSYVLPSACPHQTKLGSINGQHMRLPPTMGGWEKDDMAPDVAQINYSIKASIIQASRAGDSSRKVVETSETIKILGSSIEDPPLNITREDEVYKLQKTKKARKSLLSRPLGKVTAIATQASPFELGPDGRDANRSEATISLSFKRLASREAPPEVVDVSSKIRAYTWYSGRPVEKLPNFGYGRGAFSTTAPLKTDSFAHSSWVPESTTLDGSKGDHYTKTFKVSFDLPTSSKTFLPTFHTCLISRAYTIQLKLKVGNTNISLAVPVQVMTEGVGEQNEVDEVLPSFDDYRAYV